MQMNKVSAFIGVLFLGFGAIASADNGIMAISVQLTNPNQDHPVAYSACKDSTQSCEVDSVNPTCTSPVTSGIALASIQNANYQSSCVFFRLQLPSEMSHPDQYRDEFSVDPSCFANGLLQPSWITSWTGKPSNFSFIILQPVEASQLDIRVAITYAGIDPVEQVRNISVTCNVTKN